MSKMKFRRWSPVEDDLIRQRYPVGGSEACALVLPDRTVGAIQARANVLNVVYESHSADDDDTPIPQHDYTESDYAAREWGGPVDRSPLRWAA